MILSYLLILLFIQVTLSVFLNGFMSYVNHKIFEIAGDGNEINKLISNLQANYEVPYHSNYGNKSQILVPPKVAPIVEKMANVSKLTLKLLVEDYSQIIKNEKSSKSHNKSFSWTDYYDIDDIYGYLKNMTRAYPKCAHLIVGGKTYEGRDILGLKITTPTAKIKPVWIVESGIHPREWITTATTTYFINKLLTSDDPDILKLKTKFEWHVFPSVNPDGYHYSFNQDRLWRKNRAKFSAWCYGADLNRNFDYQWGVHKTSKNPCDPETYGGTKPFSEIETRTYSKYLSEVKNLKGYIAFHADAQMLLIPHSDTVGHGKYYDDLKKIGQTSLDYGYKVNKAKYKGPATAAEILYPASGVSFDWVHKTLDVPLGFTYELRGDGFFNWPPHRIHEQGEEVTQMILGLTVGAENLGYF